MSRSEQAPKKTVLHEEHLKLNAKMVDFGGWDMPVSYGSQIEEHHAVRQQVGMFDVSHMLNIDVQGARARDFFRHLLTNDVAKLKNPGKALYSCMLNPEGGVIDDLITYFFDEENWRMVVNAGTADKDVQWLTQQAEAFGVQLTPRRDFGMIAVQGPKARETVWRVRPEWQAATQEMKPFNAARFEDGSMVARTGYTGEDGFEIVVPAEKTAQLWQDLLAAGVQPCGLGARDTLRLEAGMNLYGSDMDESTQPYQSGLAWVVSLKDETRDFVGKKVLLQSPKKNAFLGLQLLERGVMRSHMKVHTRLGEGETTSGAFSPTMNASIAFARLPEGIEVGERVQVEIRGKRLEAVVKSLPFVRNGTVLNPE